MDTPQISSHDSAPAASLTKMSASSDADAPPPPWRARPNRNSSVQLMATLLNATRSRQEGQSWLKFRIPSITFDPNGDVMLVLITSKGTTAAHFLVNSGVLCLASPVFRARLGSNPQFKEMKELAATSQNSNNPPLAVPLSNDYPEALAIILRIIHLHYQWIPTGKTVNHKRLYQMAIICDKYEMKHAMMYWSRQWSTPLHDQTWRWSGEAAYNWLYIAYAFGDESLFMKLSRELILHSTIDLSGDLVTPVNSTGFQPLEYVPQAVIDEIQAMRKKGVDSIINMIKMQVLRYRYSTAENIQCTAEDPTCDATILGLLMRALHGIDLDMHVYVDTAACPDERRSIADLRKLLDGITLPEILTQYEGSPTVRRITFVDVFEDIYAQLSVPYLRTNRCELLQPATNIIEAVKHRAKCSPLPKLKANLAKVWEGIKGLDYSRFVGGTNTEHFAGTGSEDLWNSVGL